MGAKVVQLKRPFPPAHQPDRLSAADAIKLIRMLAADTGKIVVIPYGRKRAKERTVTRRQIELCVQKGTISEGPFLNGHGNWQVNLWRHAAGEQLTCVVAIDWVTHVLVINTF
jgi:hypothetical protein